MLRRPADQDPYLTIGQAAVRARGTRDNVVVWVKSQFAEYHPILDPYSHFSGIKEEIMSNLVNLGILVIP